MKWIVVLLAFAVAAYMIFDGLRALTVGDYVRPSSGDHAGQLGVWSKIVRAVGIDPESTAMKLIFVLYGSVWLAFLGCYLAGVSWAPTALLVAAICSLWYAPVGTVLGIIQIALLLMIRRSS
jgi:hypothetical protein